MTLDASPLEHDPMRMIARRDFRLEMENLGQRQPNQWHHREMAQNADNHAARCLHDTGEVLQTHCVPMPNITICTTMRMSHLFRRSKSPKWRKVVRINHRRRHRRNDPRGELITAQLGTETQAMARATTVMTASGCHREKLFANKLGTTIASNTIATE
jgi:hypothetical protein